MAKTVGMIGLGALGLPIAKNLIASGHEVVGYRRTNTDAFVAAGGTLASSPREVAEKCGDTALFCLSGFDAFKDVVDGADGFLAGSHEGQIVLELSTYSQADKYAGRDLLAKAGVTLVEGEVSGIPTMVEQRKGVVFYAGDERACAAVEDVVKGFTDIHYKLDAFGDALKMKLVANTLVTIHIATTAEAVNLAEKAGIDLDKLIEILGPGAGGSVQFNVRAPWMRDRRWLPAVGGFETLTHYFPLIDDMAGSSGAATPILDAAKDLYRRGLEMNLGDNDAAAIFEVLHAAKRD